MSETPAAQIVQGFNAILSAVDAIGADAARDILDAHRDSVADEMGEDTEQREIVLLELIAEAISIAGHFCEDGEDRSITIRDISRGHRLQFSWASEDPAVRGQTLNTAVMTAVREALGAGGETLAARDVTAERLRQVATEGWTPEHDDAHEDGSLARAGACYALHALEFEPFDVPEIWPLGARSWKPSAERRDLVKAGALILAEIERLDRRSGLHEARDA